MSSMKVKTNGQHLSNGATIKHDEHTINGDPEQSHLSPRLCSLPTKGTFLALVAEHEQAIQRHRTRSWDGSVKIKPIQINGDDLTMAELVAVACYNTPVQVTRDEKIRARVEASVDFLREHLGFGNVVYGINTGFGGSADTRSQDFLNVQRGLVQHQNSAVLLPSDIGREQSNTLDHLDRHKLPRAFVRGAMLTRCNSLMRGHSAVRLVIIENLVELLNRDFVPIVPLRGSISASGDLAPLSYIAGSLEGDTDIFMDCQLIDGKRQILNAHEALELAGLSPITMMPKEGLGLINGTAVSTAAASLVLHETQTLALCSQVLTGMATEGLRGSADNYHSFISRVRPHSGQGEVASNIARFLTGSQLIVGKTRETAGLYQDRYGLRTAPQWLGPQLEDIGLAIEQVRIELNATTDNPLIDADERIVHHGGNFQAVSVTSAMEKTRLALQMLGRLMFAQCSELINPTLNDHLSPNLCFDDPGVSFTFKGIDINMAAYMSELALLANPVSSHVQSAELHNQAVNSLALISSRYTMDAVELVSLMTAAYFYTACQALDLHVLHLEYTKQIEQAATRSFNGIVAPLLDSSTAPVVLQDVVSAIRIGLRASRNSSTAERARATAEATMIPLTKAVLREGDFNMHIISQFVDNLTETITTAIFSTRLAFASPAGPPTMKYLSRGSAVLYRFIRHDLGVPLHKGLVEHPPYPESSHEGIKVPHEERRTIGSRVGVIYAALRSGRFGRVVPESLS